MFGFLIILRDDFVFFQIFTNNRYIVIFRINLQQGFFSPNIFFTEPFGGIPGRFFFFIRGLYFLIPTRHTNAGSTYPCINTRRDGITCWAGYFTCMCVHCIQCIV